jgi:ADP-ribose pyrophosphatase YjhB (NUDIX family)
MSLFFLPPPNDRKRQTKNAGKKASAEDWRIAEPETKPSAARDFFGLSKAPPAAGGGEWTAAPPGIAEELAEIGRGDLVEVFDSSGRPLLCMAPESALRQSLRPRMAAVALRAGRGGILLGKRTDERLGNQGKWDMRVDFVRAGETAEDAAARIVSEVRRDGGLEAGDIPFFFVAREESGFAGPLSLFVADLQPGVYPDQPVADLLEVDEEELAGLVVGAADLLTPELVWAAGTGALFRRQAAGAARERVCFS